MIFAPLTGAKFNRLRTGIDNPSVTAGTNPQVGEARSRLIVSLPPGGRGTTKWWKEPAVVRVRTRFRLRTNSDYFVGVDGLAAARSRHGSECHLGIHSLPCRRFATSATRKITVRSRFRLRTGCGTPGSVQCSMIVYR